jgi:hypothetical protein
MRNRTHYKMWFKNILFSASCQKCICLKGWVRGWMRRRVTAWVIGWVRGGVRGWVRGGERVWVKGWVRGGHASKQTLNRLQLCIRHASSKIQRIFNLSQLLSPGEGLVSLTAIS